MIVEHRLEEALNQFKKNTSIFRGDIKLPRTDFRYKWPMKHGHGHRTRHKH